MSRAASADTDPDTEGDTASATTEATTTTLPPRQPTDQDVPLLIFAEGVELAIRDLYQSAVDAGTKGDVVDRPAGRATTATPT